MAFAALRQVLRRAPHGRGPRARARASVPVALLFSVAVAAVLIGQAALVFADPTPSALVVACLGLLAAPALVVVVQPARDAQAAAARDLVNARRLACAEATGQDVIWEADRDGIVTYMSPSTRDVFGVEPGDMVGQSMFVLLTPKEQADAQEILGECLQEKCGWADLIFETWHADGGTRLIETSAVVQLDAAGEVIGFSATSHRLDPESQRRFERRQVRACIEDVLAAGDVRTVFQPIVDVESGVAVGYEALSRFDAEPPRGPERWFADAEEVGLGVELDCLAAQAALRSAARLPDDVYVSINTTPATLASGRLETLVRTSPVASERVVVEITEHVSVEDYQALHEPLRRLRELGVRVAVDDAGSGYASFRHILRLEPQFIKLDRDLIQRIDEDPARRSLATAVVMFAREIGATVVAEGVETAGELAMVAHLGIDAAQGYLLGRPSADRAALFPHRLYPLARLTDHAAERQWLTS